MGDLGWPEILIIAAVILVLFGSKKLPDAARSLGRSMRILKTEVKGMHDDEPAQQPMQPPAALPQPPAAAQPPTTQPPTTAQPPTTMQPPATAQPAAQPYASTEQTDAR